LVETLPDIVLVADYEGRLLFANPSLEAQTGLTLEDLQRPRGENPFIHPDDRERVQKSIRDLIVSDERHSDVIENRLIDKRGRFHWYSGTVSKITYEGVPAIQVISRDITGRKRAEEELRKHRERLEELVQERTADLRRLVDAMAGREVRMAELKEVIRQLRTQLRGAGLEPIANDPLLGGESTGETEE
jgi:PAS domain S-box-containing protein